MGQDHLLSNTYLFTIHDYIQILFDATYIMQLK
jgi:hypothetical protein